jgi:predicted AlkP superfamily phosphohydrolase/phosphomutase
MKHRTLLIGLDGATFSVLDPFAAEGVMPFLKSFLARSARANLRTIVPALTPPAWTSLMTGRTPGHHGVFDFFRMESPESKHIRFFTANDVECETIWSLASRSGKRITALNFPSMFPAPRLNGSIVPGWVPWRQLRLACWPENLFDRLKAVPGFNAKELAMDIKLEAKATEGCSHPEEYKPWIELHLRREENWFEILRHLEREDPADLTGVLFDGVDKLQHLCWRFLRPEDAKPLDTEWESEIRELCLGYFRRLDQLIERLCEQAGPETTVVIASDHGFGPTREVFNVNAWLEQRGYLAWSDAAANWDTEGATLGVGQVAKHTWMLDWNRTKAFATTPTGNGIHIAISRNGHGPGVPAAEYQRFRERLSRELLEFRDPASGEQVVSQVWTREEAFDGPCGAVAPDLTLVMRDGGLVSILPAGQPLAKRAAVAGAHRPIGVLAVSGPGILRGVEVGERSILDVAPLILHSIGLPVPEEMQGSVPEEIFEAGVLERRPVRRTASVATATKAADDGVPKESRQLDPEAEQVLLERLRELGYIE